MSTLLNKEQKLLLKRMLVSAEKMGLNQSNTARLTNIYRLDWTEISPSDINFLNLVRTLYIFKVLKK